MIKALFRDSELQQQFDRDGFVILDFSSAEVVREIGTKFYSLFPTPPDGFSSAAEIADDNVKQKLFLEMDTALNKSMGAIFANYKKLGSTFLCKAPGERGHLGAHQDWTVVDETQYASATVWIPTQDVDERNGALRVLPGSHRFFDKYRNNTIPFSYRGSEQILWDNMMTVPMKAGQAFVLNHALIHGSAINRTDKERLVIVYGITSEDARLVFYYKNNKANDRIEKFEMPDDFFLRYHNIGERPLFGHKVDEFDYPVPVVSGEDIYKMIQHEKEKRKAIPYFRERWTD